jgi:hypothetical protein
MDVDGTNVRQVECNFIDIVNGKSFGEKVFWQECFVTKIRKFAFFLKFTETFLFQLTNITGYDGGAFFSPDGKKIVFRASRPKTQAELDKYKQLLR